MKTFIYMVLTLVVLTSGAEARRYRNRGGGIYNLGGEGPRRRTTTAYVVTEAAPENLVSLESLINQSALDNYCRAHFKDCVTSRTPTQTTTTPETQTTTTTAASSTPEPPPAFDIDELEKTGSAAPPASRAARHPGPAIACVGGTVSSGDSSMDGCCRQNCFINKSKREAQNYMGSTVQLTADQIFHECTCTEVPYCGIGDCQCIKEQRLSSAEIMDPDTKETKTDFIYIESCCRSVITFN